MDMGKPMYEWKDFPWRRIERNVFKLQKRIYQASLRGDVKAVHRLQKLLMKSWSARYRAVRRVTQDNRGKRTAGVDGVRKLTPPQRLKLVKRLAWNVTLSPSVGSGYPSQAMPKSEVRNPNDVQPAPANLGEAGSGPRMGSQVRTQQLRFSTRTLMS